MQFRPLQVFAIVAAIVTSAGNAEFPAPVSAFVIESTVELDLGSTLATAPKWSPDGQWIAFGLPKGDGIGIVRPDGSAFRKLTSEPRSGYRFSWAPDSSRIAIRATAGKQGPRNYVIRVIDIQNGEVESSTEPVGDLQPPEWQTGPSGMRWVSHGPKGELEGGWQAGKARSDRIAPPLIIQQKRELWLQAPDTKKKHKLSATAGLHPKWNPAKSMVAFDARDRIHLASADGQPGARELCVGQHPAWSPDGNWIVYQITRDHTHEGEDARQHTPDTEPHRHDDKTNHQIVDSDLWVISSDGTKRQQLTATPEILETDPDWAPDGSALVCRDERTGKLRILKLRRL